VTEIITRNHLPHWYVPGAAHFVTFRLAGSLPRAVIQQMKQRKELLLNQTPSAPLSTSQHHERVHKLLFAAYDKQLDAGSEVRWLDDPRIAALVRRSLYFWHGQKYDLLAYAIMPNHVHVLFLPRELPPRPVDSALRTDEIGETSDQKSPLSDIMHSLKSYTAHEANKLLRRDGQFWQHESYDHWVRDEEELERIVEYINGNAIKAGLVAYAHEFFWCSAHDRFLHDADPSGWLPVGQAPRLPALS
jgi:putative DNA methylase